MRFALSCLLATLVGCALPARAPAPEAPPPAQASDAAHLYQGNAARLLVDGPATFAAMRSAVHAARTRVLLESYIFDDEGLAAEMAELLAAKVRSGVGVAVLYDSVGSRESDDAFFESLRARGISVCAFNPVDPLRRPGYWGINHRDHRKFLVADAQVGFTGGINISKVYASGSRGGGSSASGGGDDDWRRRGWRDTQIELRGPVVEAIAASFETLWRAQGCRDALPAPPAEPARAHGRTAVQLLVSAPEDPGNPIYDALLHAIDSAQRSVHLTMAYFAPGKQMSEALRRAALRGVDVRLVLPARSDFGMVLHAGRAYYDELLAAGVHIHELQTALLHAKTAVIDGAWSTVGSSNMDWRSWVDNHEANAVVFGEEFGRSLEMQFDRDLAASRPITLDEWRRRGLGERLLEGVGRLAERLF